MKLTVIAAQNGWIVEWEEEARFSGVVGGAPRLVRVQRIFLMEEWPKLMAFFETQLRVSS